MSTREHHDHIRAARDVRPPARRRRAGPRPAAGRVDRPRAAARGGRRARQHRARPARAGPCPAHATPARSRAPGAPRTTSPTCATSATSSTAAGRAAERRLRRHHRPPAGVLDLPARALPAAGRLARRDARRRRGQGRQGGRLPPRPRHPVGAAARRRHRGVAPPDAGRARRPSGRTSPSCSRPTSSSRGWSRDGVAVDVSTLRPEWESYVGRCSPRRRSIVPDGVPALPGGGRRGVHTEALGLPARRDAAPAPLAPRSVLVSRAATSAVLAVERARSAAAAVLDPEVPVLTIDDLGVLRDVTVDDDGRRRGRPSRRPTPGCPAMEVIEHDVEPRPCARPASTDVRSGTVLSPAWTTDWMTREGRRKLADYGIAPPGAAGPRSHTPAARSR